MRKVDQFYLKQLNELHEIGHIILQRSKYKDLSDIPFDERQELYSRVRAAVVRISGVNSTYYQDLQKTDSMNIHFGWKLRRAIGTLNALKSDVENGYTESLIEVIHADLFTDYLEMSEHLVEEGYKDAAAVIAGSTLESHIRKLCEKCSIPTIGEKNGKSYNVKADRMNADLAKESAYEKTHQQQITAWLKIRNESAHGNYDTYSKEQVQLMLQGIRMFIATHPA